MIVLWWAGLLLGLGLLQSFLPQVWSPLGTVDWLLLPVVHQALRRSLRHGLLIGAAAGVVQDGLTGGLIGLHGFAKTCVAAVVGAFGSMIVVRGPLPEATVATVAAVLEASIVVLWRLVLDRPTTSGPLEIAWRALATGIALAVVLATGRWLERRRRRRSPGRLAS